MNYKILFLSIILSVCTLFVFVIDTQYSNAQSIQNTSSGYSDPSFTGPRPETRTTDFSLVKNDLKANSFQQLVTNFVLKISALIIRLLVTLSLFVFLFGLMKYMFKGQGSDTARVEGRKLMLWGIIGLFVIVSVWSLVGIIASLVGHTDIATPQFRIR